MKTTTTTLAAMIALSGSLLPPVEGGACKPVTTVMSRATGTAAKFDTATGKWTIKFPLSTVNTASVHGSLKFVMTETIDAKDGYAECVRKNGVSHIQFYKVIYCNPDPALWWFNAFRPHGYGGVTTDYNLGEWGDYIAFDGGKCNDRNQCDLLNGERNRPRLGPYVGWQVQENDPRNPTDMSYWYSLPGECPSQGWDDKDAACTKKYPTGACAPGIVPDGKNCTWAYELLGQVRLDDIVGITSLINPATGKPFTNSTEYCKAGNVEFERSSNYSMIRGLDFWKDPLNKTANKVRIDALLATYKSGLNNIALPDMNALRASNPRCYETSPGCFKDGKETCTRNIDMVCVPCDQVDGGCAPVTDPSRAFAAGLKFEEEQKVLVPTGPSGDAVSGALQLAASFALGTFVALAASYMM